MTLLYSHKTFLTKVPNALLARFFQERHNVLHEINFKALKENNIDSIFDAMKALSRDTLREIEADCQSIDAMACQGGWTAIVDEANYHGNNELPLKYQEYKSFHCAAMSVFLDYRKFWEMTAYYRRVGTVPASRWRKRRGLPHQPAHAEQKDIDMLKDAISRYFHHKEGRGLNCSVDVYSRHDNVYFFAFPEDFVQSDLEWVQDVLATPSRSPVFQVVFMYSQKDGTLDIYAPYNTKAIPELQKIFAQHILKLEDISIFSDPGISYVLEELANPDFIFQYPSDCGIESVAVSSLRLSFASGSNKRRIIIETDPSADRGELYEFLTTLKLPPYNITQAEITVCFADRIGGGACKQKKFKISTPHWCALGYSGTDLIIRKMLIASGIECESIAPAPTTRGK